MRIRNIILAVCLAALMPGLANAKRPQPTPEPGCSIAVSQYIYLGNQYTVKVVSNSGAWRNPTISVTARYTLNDGSIHTTTDVIEGPQFGSLTFTYVNVDLTVPTDAVQFSEVDISAKVEDPLKKRNTFRETTCNIVSNIQ